MNFLILGELTSEITSEIIEATTEASSEGSAVAVAVEPVAEWIRKAWEWCNQPLPIVGISLITIIIFLWRVLVSTNYGKKAVAKLQSIADDTRNATDKTLAEMKAENEAYRAQLESLEEQVEIARGALETVCANSRNKQVKELADMLKREEVSEDGGEEKESQEGTDGDADEE